MSSTKALKPGSVVLITGVNGYVGGHIAEQVLSLGYRVRGTARDQAKIDVVTKGFKKYADLFEGVILADMTSEDAFSHVVKGADAVIHVASDLSFGPDPNVVVTSTEKAMVSVLKAAAKESGIKRFVYTSSIVAAADSISTEGTPTLIDEKSWNNADVERAWAPGPYEPDRSFAVYAASKVAGEKAAWKFVEEEKPHFVLNAVSPALCIGPKAFDGQNLSTAGWVQGFYEGVEAEVQKFTYIPPGWSVDVRDVARAHVAALLETDIVGRRIIAAVEPEGYSVFTSLFKKINPKGPEYPAAPSTTDYNGKVDNSLALELLKREGRSNFVSAEQSLRDQFASA